LRQWRVMAVASALMLTAAFARGQETQPATTRASTPNIEKALQKTVRKLVANETSFGNVLGSLGESENINIVVNWRALADAGVMRDVPISLRLHDVLLEDAIRAILIATPTHAGWLNYVVGGGAVEITTNAEIGKNAETRLYDVAGTLKDPFDTTPDQTKQSDAEKTLIAFLRTELLHAGERVDGEGRELIIRDNMLAATTSARGHVYVRRALEMLSQPVRPGQWAPGTPVSVAARKAEESLNALLSQHAATLVDIAKSPAFDADTASATNKALADANLNVVQVPGTAQELDKPSPSLAYQINSAGIILIGPAATVRPPILAAVYDLRDLLKRLAFRTGKKPMPSPADFAGDVVAGVKAKVQSAPWGDLTGRGEEPKKPETSLTVYHGLLIVFAPAAIQREVSAALQELYK